MRKILLTLLASVMLLMTVGNFPQALAVNSKSAVQIVIDASGSMRGSKIEETKAAIIKTVNVLPKDVFLRVILIKKTPSLLVDFTQDKAVVEQAIRKITAGGNTALYDSVSLALSQNSEYSPNRVVVLSDGKDTSSQESLDKLLILLNEKKVPIDIVALKVSSVDQGILKEITGTSGGYFFSTSNLDELSKIYLKIFSGVIQKPEEPTEKPGSQGSDSPVASNSIEKFVDTYKRIIPLALAVLLFILLYILLKLFMEKNSRDRVQIRRKESIKSYIKVDHKNQPFDLNKLKINSRIRLPNFIEKKLDLIVEAKHLVFPMAILRIVVIGVYFITFLVILFFFQNGLVSLILATAAMPFIISKYTIRSVNLQREKLANDLPSLLTLASGGLKSGLSVEQTFDAYSMQDDGELAIQLRRTMREVQMGETLEISLMNLAKRMENTDLEWIVTALTIQKTVGGSLAEIIDTVLETIKSRVEIRREVRTLSAEGRLSALVLIFLPITIFLFLVLTQREYVKIYWTNPLGVVVLIFIGILMFVGWLWMKKVVEIKV